MSVPSRQSMPNSVLAVDGGECPETLKDLPSPERDWITASHRDNSPKRDNSFPSEDGFQSADAMSYDEHPDYDDTSDTVCPMARDAFHKADVAHVRADEAYAKADIAYDKATSVRRLVLCFDGTGQPIYKNSNVLQFFRCLRKDDERQIAYYQSGLATYTHPTFTRNPITATKNLVDKAIAWSIKRHVQDAYCFLVQNYKPGDKISLFGFSRGAYTARVLCGFVQKVGLLPHASQLQIPYAWQMFEHSDDKGGLEKCVEYKRVFSISVHFDFVGLWDTVASLGIRGTELPFAEAKPEGEKDIRVFRHALALDERRVTFAPNFKLTVNGPQSEPESYSPDQDEMLLNKSVREVWFAGCHSDVGGGSKDKWRRNSLARIPLRWMIRECFHTETGITFDKDMLVDIGFGSTPFYEDSMPINWHLRHTAWKSLSNKNEPATFFTRVRSFLSHVFGLEKQSPVTNADTEEQAVNENMEELHDALSTIHDQLSYSKLWWLRELFPKAYRVQDSRNGERGEFKKIINLGRGRKIYGDAWNTTKDYGEERGLEWYIEVHESVRTRIEKYEGPKSKRYKPLAWFSVPDANGGAPGSEFHWEGELEEMCTSKAGQMIRWVK